MDKGGLNMVQINRYLNQFAEFRQIVADREDMQGLSEYEVMLLWQGHCILECCDYFRRIRHGNNDNSQ